MEAQLFEDFSLSFLASESSGLCASSLDLAALDDLSLCFVTAIDSVSITISSLFDDLITELGGTMGDTSVIGALVDRANPIFDSCFGGFLSLNMLLLVF